jgi:hypothetical protein
MSRRVESQNSPWKPAKEERNPILLGLACGAAASAIVPLIKPVFESGNRWIRDWHHIDRNAVPAVMISIALLAIFVCPGPILLRWSKAYGTGVNRGAFSRSRGVLRPGNSLLAASVLVGSLDWSDLHWAISRGKVAARERCFRLFWTI